MQKIMKSAAEVHIPDGPILKNGKISYLADERIKNWAKKRPQLRYQYTSTDKTDVQKRENLQKKRNRYMKKIKLRQQKI